MLDQIVPIHGVTPPASRPSQLMSHATSAAVRHALRAIGSAKVLDVRLRHAANNACADARSAGLGIEEMLVAVKEDWNAHPEVRRLPPGPRRSDVTSRFVTLCIHEFFAANAADRSAAVGGA